MAATDVPLVRRFTPVARDAAVSEEDEFAMLLGHTGPKRWSDLEKEYRVVILADAGAGKTFEMRARAAYVAGQKHSAFFIRIEDLNDSFADSFEVGSALHFEKWLESSDEAWFFLDSVDEVRLDSPAAFEKAIRRFANRIKDASHRAHVYISSRPYAWQFKADRELVEQVLPFAPLQSEPAGDQDEALQGSAENQPKEALQIFFLTPLDLDDIRLFATHRFAADVDQLMTDIERANLMAIAGRPFDLEGLLAKWKADGRLGSRFELLQHNISLRLDEIDPDRKRRQPLNQQKAREGARLLAAAVTLTGQAGINVPDSSHEKLAIDAEQVLSDWHPNDVWALVERGIFNDVIYGAVRFRQREVRELLTAEWFYSLLQKGNSRRAVESLIFREQYGERVIAPRLRPVLPWLILFDEPIRRRALALHPEIAVEGGDAARLPLPERRRILGDIVARIVADDDDHSARDNAAIARIAQPDLSSDVLRLIVAHEDHDDAIFFLGRLVWQGNMADCLDALLPIAIGPARGLYARIASVRAISTSGTAERKATLWQTINQVPGTLPREILAELMQNASADSQSVNFLLTSINKLPPYERFKASGLGRALHAFIDRLPTAMDRASDQPLAVLVAGLNGFLDREPHHERRECRVSKDFTWLMGPASHTVERLISARAEESLDDAAMSVLLKVPAVRHWHGEDFDEYKDKLQELVPKCLDLNDSLFWRSIAEARAERDAKKGERLIDDWPVQWMGHYWHFGADSFPRILELIKSRQLEDDRLVALSLAFRIYVEADKPTKWRDKLWATVFGDAVLEARLQHLISPPASAEQRRVQEADASYKRRRAKERRNQERNRAKWIERLRANPSLVLNPPGLKQGELSDDQYWLFCEVEGSGLRTRRDEGANWQSLVGDFGEGVARAFRDSAVAHWRVFQPGLRSESADTKSIPNALLFAMAGLEIEAREVGTFPRNLTQSEINHALRYITWELNGFPSWLEAVYKAQPEIVRAAVWHELSWELENTPSDQPMHYILHDLVYYAPWLHKELVDPILKWHDANQLRNTDSIRYCLRILANGGANSERLTAMAQSKVSSDGPENQLTSWYALWVDTQPETGIPAVEAWLGEKDASAASLAAQLFITTLLGGRRGNNEAFFRKFYTPSHLKRLYVLTHRHIKAKDDIDRAGKGAYSPNLRDDAQDARNQLFNLLADIPGKGTYLALTELAHDHPDDGYRTWMGKRAHKHAEQDADLEPWKPQQVRDFDSSLQMEPTSHKQLFDIGVLHLNDFKDWLERGNDSLAETYQKISGETEMRKVVANWLNQHARGRYTCAQENPLANDQRPDIWLQHPDVTPPVPIELKLLDKGWSGPNLCERLRNQLAGDYLREERAGCGIMLLVWQGSEPGRRWDVGGEMTGVAGLREALLKYWAGISDQFPNVFHIEIVVIDLTLRAEISAR